MIPTQGRIVLVYGRPGLPKPLQPEVGLITFVHGDNTHINVVAFSHQGQMHIHTSIPLLDGEAELPQSGLYAEWPLVTKAPSPPEKLQPVAPAGTLGGKAPPPPTDPSANQQTGVAPSPTGLAAK